MNHKIFEASEALMGLDKTVAVVRPDPPGRLLFVDNIRTMLTIQVLLFHLMIIYAGTGSWIYQEGGEDFITGMIGAYFVVVSQAYFMGLFLLISAYFVPGAYDRKGSKKFLKDRLVRLGIPLAFYSWIISPLLVYLDLRVTEGVTLPWWDYFPGLKHEAFIGSGPLWFVETLLIFTLLYALRRRLARPVQGITAPASSFPSNGSIFLFALLLAVASFLVRQWRPIFWNFAPLNLQFPFFAQYIAMFIVGLIAYRRNWLLSLPDSQGRLWLGVGVLMILLFLPMIMAGGMEIEPFLGGWHWQALVYAVWESFVCLGISIGLIYLFRRYADRQGRLARALSRNAYGAYVIHGLVITVIALAVRDISLYPLLKWALVSLVAIPLCFGLSSLLIKLPIVDRVL